jgi:hypothetical protein
LDRIRTAIVVPAAVFAVCAALAIGVGMLLHLVHDISEETPLGVYGTPLAALVLVLVVTAGGFIASGAAGPEPK